ncbi:MAG: glucose-6-phosphate dehydrogenase [Actinomycetota bacterium]
MTGLPPQAIVIFGASGDVTRRKLLPAFFHLFAEGLLPRDFRIIGYARSGWTPEAFREHAQRAIAEFGRKPPTGEVWEAFASHLTYVRGEFGEAGSFAPLAAELERVDAELGARAERFLYCATPPEAYADIVARAGESGIAPGARIVFEKPFGHDLASAVELNAAIHAVFAEEQVFRIDHYMGKETVQNILAFRFGNGMFEPIWNRRYIDHIQITVAEELGLEGRAGFYEPTGAIRDMVQTHLLQVLTFVAMEPPVSFEPDRLRDEKIKVLRSMHPVDPARVVRGQYRGYLEEPGVDRHSTTETFVAMELAVENWRWAGVPFYLRTGKRLDRKVSEVTLVFRDVPYNVFREADVALPRRDHLSIRIQPNEGITLALNAKRPGPGLDLGRVTMDFDYEREFDAEVFDAYELLLLEAMEGDHTLFLRQDVVERAWEILEPALAMKSAPVRYEPASWGPDEADLLIQPHRWHTHAARRTGTA